MSDLPEAPPPGSGPSAAAVEVKHRGLITLSIMAATIMQVLDTTIANVALPSMTGDLGASQDTINWVLTSYIVASAIMTPVTGWLADRLGKRELFLISIVGFVAMSLACGIAWSLPSMVIFRLLQGVWCWRACRCLASQPVDFRKGPDGLVGLVRDAGADPFNGSLYVFRAKRADRIKIVWWDGTGLCLYAKRLEKAAFCWPRIGSSRVQLSHAQLLSLVEGMDWKRVRSVPVSRPQSAG